VISPNRIIDEIARSKQGLFRTFFPKFKSNSIKNFKNFKKFKTIILIGMGGSILGTKAIYSFLRNKVNKKIIFIDNLDQRYLVKIKKENNLKTALFLIISKSGNTTETIVNSSFFKAYLKKKNSIIISEDKDNVLRNFAKKKNIPFIRHHPNIGGRYSVFSDVGMLPSYLMGLKIENFKKNIPNLLKNKQILSEEIKKIFKINCKKTKVLVLFNYVPELNDFMFWCQQLLAESLGKNGKGFMPVVSTAPRDHHSLLQLYLDGPKDKTFYVFSLKDGKNFQVNSKIFGKKVKYLNKKKYENIKISQKNAFLGILKEKKIPFEEIVIKKFDEGTIGRLFFLFIFQTIVLSKILKVNAFDQPAVESVKVLTKKLLILKKFNKKNL
tara:strand:+ start:5309 stop:6454 length:1146 start_codon:yes stop_codon:yes gene_type:complete